MGRYCVENYGSGIASVVKYLHRRMCNFDRRTIIVSLFGVFLACAKTLLSFSLHPFYKRQNTVFGTMSARILGVANDTNVIVFANGACHISSLVRIIPLCTRASSTLCSKFLDSNSQPNSLVLEYILCACLIFLTSMQKSSKSVIRLKVFVACLHRKILPEQSVALVRFVPVPSRITQHGQC